MSPVRQRFFSTPSCFRANVGIRFTKAADLRVSLCFRASAPSPDEYFAYRTLQPRYFEEISLSFGRIVFLFCNPAACFPTCSPYLRLLMGRRSQPDPHETILALHSVRLPRASKRSCFASCRGGGQSFETSGSNNRLCQ